MSSSLLKLKLNPIDLISSGQFRRGSLRQKRVQKQIKEDIREQFKVIRKHLQAVTRRFIFEYEYMIQSIDLDQCEAHRESILKMLQDSQELFINGVCGQLNPAASLHPEKNSKIFDKVVEHRLTSIERSTSATLPRQIASKSNLELDEAVASKTTTPREATVQEDLVENEAEVIEQQTPPEGKRKQAAVAPEPVTPIKTSPELESPVNSKGDPCTPKRIQTRPEISCSVGRSRRTEKKIMESGHKRNRVASVTRIRSKNGVVTVRKTTSRVYVIKPSQRSTAPEPQPVAPEQEPISRNNISGLSAATCSTASQSTMETTVIAKSLENSDFQTSDAIQNKSVTSTRKETGRGYIRRDAEMAIQNLEALKSMCNAHYAMLLNSLPDAILSRKVCDLELGQITEEDPSEVIAKHLRQLHQQQQVQWPNLPNKKVKNPLEMSLSFFADKQRH
jgi:hypothetical protein